jgi:hypothetical protein
MFTPKAKLLLACMLLTAMLLSVQVTHAASLSSDGFFARRLCGVEIEEVQIADLQSYLKLMNKADITNMCTSLMNASYPHLSAFTNQLSQYPWSAGPEHSQRFSGRLPREIDCLIHGQRLAL